MDHSHSDISLEGKVEKDAVHVSGIVIFLMSLAVLISVTLVAAYLSFFFLEKMESKKDAGLPSMMEGTVAPPEPRLQVTPVVDLERVVESEQKTLNGYGWMDQGNGIAHIPIERAMQIEASKKQPAAEKKES